VFTLSVLASCRRHDDAARRQDQTRPDEQQPLAAQPADQPQRTQSNDAQLRTVRARTVYAAWYDVPVESLAKKRAGLDELTAAHNRLPLGTLVRVTHLANGKSVLVRITDRGIHDHKLNIDLCREAADRLGMVGKGIAKVRIEVLAEETATATKVAGAVPGAAASASADNTASNR
jgi:rare lipoprotein A